MVVVWSFFLKEIIEAIRKPRSFALKIAFPSVFTIPVLLSAAPTVIGAGILTMIALMVGVFGISVGLTKDRSEGVLTRALMAPIPSWAVIMGHVASGTAVEMLQLAPVLAVVFLKSGRGVAWGLVMLAVAVVTALSANLLGVLVSALSTGSGDVHLYSVLVVFPLIGISGVFRAPGAMTSALAGASLISPLTYFNRGIISILGQSSGMSAQTLLVGSTTVALTLILITVLLADRILRRELP